MLSFLSVHHIKKYAIILIEEVNTMRYLDFKSALKFLEEFGFEYGMDSMTNKRECYRNFYGEIILEYYRLDANEYIPQICIEINGWKSKIDIDEKHKNLSGRNYYTKLHDVIKLELFTNYKIYNLKVENQYLTKVTKVCEYIYSYNKEQFLEKLKRFSSANNKIRIINDKQFSMAVENNHAGCLWYVAEITEENNLSKISGKIITNPDENGNQSRKPYTTKEKIKDTFWIIIGLILLWWIVLFVYLIVSVSNKIKKNECNEIQNVYTKLDNFMINKFGCKKIDNLTFETFGQIKMKKNDLDYSSFANEVINLIFSSDIRDYLNQNFDSLNIMQIATLIMENKTDKIKLLKLLKNLTGDNYVKKLFSIAIKETKKYGCDDKKTAAFYTKKDPRMNKPSCPFNEYIKMPILLNKFDVALYKEDGKENLVVIYKHPSYENPIQEYDEECYLAYTLLACERLDDYKLFQIHCHPHACNLEKVDFEKLTDVQKNYYKIIVDYLKNKFDNQIEN